MTVEHPADAADSSILPGFGDVLGATVTPDGVNFAVYARRATGLELLLFDSVDDPAAAARRIPLHHDQHRTGDYWHALVPGLAAGQLYGFAAHGPWDPDDGLRFDPTRVLLDPYGRGHGDARRLPPPGRRPTRRHASVPMKSVVIDPSTYDWEGDRPLDKPFRETIVYEAHLAGFTPAPIVRRRARAARHVRRLHREDPVPGRPRRDRGRAPAGLPVRPADAPRTAAPTTGATRRSRSSRRTLQYAVGREASAAVDEFRDLVKALHRAGHRGHPRRRLQPHRRRRRGRPDAQLPRASPTTTTTCSTRTIGRATSTTRGCGNTLNANGPVVRRLIRDSLRYWVDEMHVDGFRFDLASVLSRDEAGLPMPEPPIL